MKYDGKFASRWRAKSPDALCAVLPLSDDFLIIKRALCLAYCGHSAFSFVKIQSARAFYMSMFKNGIFHNVKFVKNAGEGEN